MDGLLGKLNRLLDIMPDTDEKQVGTAVFQLIRQFVNECGFRELEGIGFSAVKEQGGLYHNRFVCSRPGQAPPQGLVWKMVDAENTPLKSKLDWLPKDTVLAGWGPCRLQPVWQWVKQSLQKTGNPVLIQGFQAGVDQLEQHGMALDPWLSSLADHVAMVVTVDPEKKVQMPQPGGKALDLPVAAAALLLEVKDDTIFQAVDAFLEAMGEQLPVTRLDAGDMRQRSMAVPLPVPYDFSPTIARLESYLIVASNPGIIANMNACRKAEAPRLAENPEFQTYAKGLPENGTGFSFVSRRYTETISDLVIAATAQEASPMTGEVFGLLKSLQKPQTSYAVTVNMPDALVSVSRTNVNLAQTMILQVAAMPVALMGGIVMPALGQARTQAHQVSDMSNLKQLSLGLIMYADEHDAFPQSLAELWDEGYVDTPRVFVSPAGQTAPPQSAQQVREGQCDYIYFVPGARLADFNDASATPMLCTRPGLLAQGVNVAYADGHVERKDVIDPELQTLIQTHSRE